MQNRMIAPYYSAFTRGEQADYEKLKKFSVNCLCWIINIYIRTIYQLKFIHQFHNIYLWMESRIH